MEHVFIVVGLGVIFAVIVALSANMERRIVAGVVAGLVGEWRRWKEDDAVNRAALGEDDGGETGGRKEDDAVNGAALGDDDVKDDAEQLAGSDSPRTKQLMMETLRSIGCQPEEREEGQIWFDYQGIKFLVTAADEYLFVNLVWPWCHHFSQFDIDHYANVRKTINEINARCACTLYYIPNSEMDEVAVHIKKNFMFVPQMPQLDKYLRSELSEMFDVARNLEVELQKLESEE